MPKKKDDTVETPENMGQIAAGGEDAANKAGTSPEEGTEGKPENSQEFAPEQEVSELESMNVLADRHRVPTWQQSAVNRLMGWEAGKMVSNADYVSALDKLKARPVGGGRMG